MLAVKEEVKANIKFQIIIKVFRVYHLHTTSAVMHQTHQFFQVAIYVCLSTAVALLAFLQTQLLMSPFSLTTRSNIIQQRIRFGSLLKNKMYIV